jgi:hypothetical protein
VEALAGAPPTRAHASAAAQDDKSRALGPVPWLCEHRKPSSYRRTPCRSPPPSVQARWGGIFGPGSVDEARDRPLTGAGCYNCPEWACSTAVSAGDSSRKVPSCGNARSGRDEFRESFARQAHGNPEPSRQYTGGRCRDYLRAARPTTPGTPCRGDSVRIVGLKRDALNDRHEPPAPSCTSSARVKR